MNTIDILFGISNGLFLIAAYPMIKAAIKNKASMKGFSFCGSLLTTAGMFTTIIALIYIHTYTSALLAVPTLFYWSIVTYYNR
jgi:hypothetical protein